MGTQIYSHDLEIAQALIRKDEYITRTFFFGQCYPLFNSIYKRYYTDCDSCMEFINEIYILILTPGKKTHHCQLENYRGESTLTSWLKATCLYFCYARFKKKSKIDIANEASLSKNETISSDRFATLLNSIGIDESSINHHDIDQLLASMGNERYREIIRLFYVEMYSNEEVAQMLDLSMSNFYNKKILAKDQFRNVLIKEMKNE